MPSTTLDIMKSSLKRTEERRQNPQEIWGVPWGVRSLDKLTGGIHPEQFTVLGAMPGAGKTAFLCQLAVNTARWAHKNLDGKVVKIISCEMSKELIQQRMAFFVDALRTEKMKKDDPGRVISALTQRKVESGFLNDEEWKRYKEAQLYVAELPIEIEDDPVSPEATRRWLEEGGRCVWWGLDYLQKHPTGVSGLSGEDVRGAQELSQKFQKIAQHVSPGMALSSLNARIRDRENHRPELYDLYGGAKVGHDATIAAFLHRPDMWEGKQNPDEKHKPKFCQFIVAKNRFGPLAEFDFLYSPENWSFVDITDEE